MAAALGTRLPQYCSRCVVAQTLATILMEMDSLHAAERVWHALGVSGSAPALWYTGRSMLQRGAREDGERLMRRALDSGVNAPSWHPFALGALYAGDVQDAVCANADGDVSMIRSSARIRDDMRRPPVPGVQPGDITNA